MKSCKKFNETAQTVHIFIYSIIPRKTPLWPLMCSAYCSRQLLGEDDDDVGDDDDDDDGEDGQLLGDDQKEISFPLARRVTLILISLLIAQWGFFGKQKLFLFQSVFSVTGK